MEKFHVCISALYGCGRNRPDDEGFPYLNSAYDRASGKKSDSMYIHYRCPSQKWRRPALFPVIFLFVRDGCPLAGRNVVFRRKGRLRTIATFRMYVFLGRTVGIKSMDGVVAVVPDDFIVR